MNFVAWRTAFAALAFLGEILPLGPEPVDSEYVSDTSVAAVNPNFFECLHSLLAEFVALRYP